MTTAAGKRIGVAILGSTGSIGVSTLDVLARHRDRYSVVALTAHTNLAKLADQCREHRPQFAVIGDTPSAPRFQEELHKLGLSTQVLAGS